MILFADPGEHGGPEGQREGEEGELEEGREGVDGADDGDPDAPGGDEDGDDVMFVEVPGEDVAEIVGGEALREEVVGAGVEEAGEEGVVEELVDGDLGGDGAEGEFVAEEEGLEAVKGVDEGALAGPHEGGDEEGAGVGLGGDAFLEADDF